MCNTTLWNLWHKIIGSKWKHWLPWRFANRFDVDNYYAHFCCAIASRYPCLANLRTTNCALDIFDFSILAAQIGCLVPTKLSTVGENVRKSEERAKPVNALAVTESYRILLPQPCIAASETDWTNRFVATFRLSRVHKRTKDETICNIKLFQHQRCSTQRYTYKYVLISLKIAFRAHLFISCTWIAFSAAQICPETLSLSFATNAIYFFVSSSLALLFRA